MRPLKFPTSWRHSGKPWSEWLGAHSLLMLLAAVAALAAVWGFAALAGEVLEGDTRAFDTWVLKSLRRADNPQAPIGPAWLIEAGRDITALGGVAVLALFCTIVAGYTLLARNYRATVLVLATSLGGVLLSFGLKRLLMRDRPTVVPHLTEVVTSSFPSGHSLMSAVVYLTLGVLLAGLVHSRRLKFYVLAVAMVLTLVVGLSRIYLGVHYPTDVFAGWMAGLAWAVFCWLGMRFLKREGVVHETEE